MNVLVLCDDAWHPAENARRALAPIGEAGFTFTFIDNAADWSAEVMADYPITLLTKANHTSSKDTTPWMSDEAEAALQKYVSKGGGLLVLHSGTAGYLGCATFRKLLGGVFTHHPPQCCITVLPKQDHFITSEVADFEYVDEHYNMDMDPRTTDIFLTISSEYGKQPAGWTRTEGQGRVCVLTPGHNLPLLLDFNYQDIIYMALHWCGKID